MDTKLKLKELEEKVEKLAHELSTTTDNLCLLMNFVNKDKVAVKFHCRRDLFIGESTLNNYCVYKVYYFSGNNIRCANIPSLYSYGSKNWNKEVPYRVTRNDNKAIIIEFDYPKSMGGCKTHLIDKANGTLTDITL